MAANVKVFMKLWQLKNVRFNQPQKQNSDLKSNAHSSSHNFINTLLGVSFVRKRESYSNLNAICLNSRFKSLIVNAQPELKLNSELLPIAPTSSPTIGNTLVVRSLFSLSTLIADFDFQG
jgi:hypothetical protein